MFYRKNERKTHNVRVILIVGALAAVGAMSIFRCGKQMAGEALCKVKSMFRSEKVMCPDKIETEQEQ